jgi:hypothetical protein
MKNELIKILSDSNKDIDNQKLMDYLSDKLSAEEIHEMEKLMVNSPLVNDAVWNSNLINYKGKKYNPPGGKINKKNIKWISGKYLNTSYLWGGKSVFGIDCSGFTQSVYKFLNIYLPRDSWQQAELGDTVDHLHGTNCGDLCFFENEEGRITHVGLLLNNHTIIHSSGKVRIDKIDNVGIINSDTGQQRTHKIKLIKRYFS